MARSHCFYCLCNCCLLLYLRIVLALAEICFCRVYSQSTFILIKFLYFVAQCIVKAFFGKVSRYIALSLPSSQLLHCRGASAQLAIIGTVAIVIVIQKRRPQPTFYLWCGCGTCLQGFVMYLLWYFCFLWCWSVNYSELHNW